MAILFILIALGLACGGALIDTPFLYDLHLAAGIAIGILTWLIIPLATSRSHDHKLYQMYVTVSMEQEKMLKAIMAKMNVEDPLEEDERTPRERPPVDPPPLDDDDREDPEDYRL